VPVQYDPIFGLPILIDGTLAEDDYAFGRFAERLAPVLSGVLNHTHDGVANELEEPSDVPTAVLDPNNADGSLPAGGSVFYAYTLVDAHNRESLPSAAVEVELPDVLGRPSPPSCSYTATGGTLPSGRYAYALSAYTVDTTHETVASVPTEVIVAPTGASTNEITVTFPTLPEGADGWNVYRLRPGTVSFVFLAAVDMSGGGPPATYVDDGSVAEDAQRLLPFEDHTSGTNAVTITLPDNVVPVGYTWKLYRTSIDGYWERSLVHHIVEETSEGSGIITPEFLDTGFPTDVGSPPIAAQTIPNPGKINLENGVHVTGRLPLGFQVHPHTITFHQPGPVAVGVFDQIIPLLGAYQLVSLAAMLSEGSSPSATPIVARLVTADASNMTAPLNNWQLVGDVSIPVGDQGAIATFSTQLGGPPAEPMQRVVGTNALTIQITQDGGGTTPTDANLTVVAVFYLDTVSTPVNTTFELSSEGGT